MHSLFLCAFIVLCFINLLGTFLTRLNLCAEGKQKAHTALIPSQQIFYLIELLLSYAEKGSASCYPFPCMRSLFSFLRIDNKLRIQGRDNNSRSLPMLLKPSVLTRRETSSAYKGRRRRLNLCAERITKGAYCSCYPFLCGEGKHFPHTKKGKG